MNSKKNSQMEFSDDIKSFRFSWFFYRTSYEGNQTYEIIATIAQVLDHSTDIRCVDSKKYSNTLCVIVEQDFDQCNDENIINSGYLAYNVYGRFKILAIWSHGADDCLDAQYSVGFFNRIDKNPWKNTIDNRIITGECTEE